MSAYLIPIQTALFLFPLLALLLTIPYILHQYRTYGATLPIRVLIVFSFIFYLLCCYFLVSLPLPPMKEVANYTTPTMQLVPFASLKEITLTTSLVWNDPSTYLTALNEPSLLQVLFNLLMTIPFGVYLRYYFRYSLKKTFLISFLLSLSFECLQLSGLFFLYPRPYRLFDVDDLITNTLGGLLGYGLTPLLVHFLPTRAALDEKSYHKGQSVSAIRRCFAFSVDVLLLLVSYFVMLQLLPVSVSAIAVYGLLVLFYFMILPMLTKGKTLGKMLVKIQLVPLHKNSAVWYQYPLHFLPTYLFLIPFPLILVYFITQFAIAKPPLLYIWYAGFALCISFYLFYLIYMMRSLFHHEDQLYEKIAQLRNCSTIQAAARAEDEDKSEPAFDQHDDSQPTANDLQP